MDLSAVNPRRQRSCRARTSRRTSRRPGFESLETRDLPAPLAPTGLVATGISASAISLSWSASTDPSVTGYDVYEKVWIRGIHSPRGSGGTPGHYVYQVRANDLANPSDTLTGLKGGTTHTYVVTAVGPAGQSPYSATAVGETWIAPSFPNGPNTFLLSSGALWSGPVNVSAGLTSQLSLLVAGNPLNFSVVSGPSTASIDPKSGVVTFTPGIKVSGTVDVTFKAANPLGSVTQKIQFNVAPANPRLIAPTLRLDAKSAIYDGKYQQVSAHAVGADGMTPVSGSFAIAYNGGKSGYPSSAGTYPILVTFTSNNPKYSNATLLATFTITRATPVFTNLSAPTIAEGTATTVVSGNISAGTAVPVGDQVVITLNGVSQQAAVDANGHFSSTFSTGGLSLGTEKITYAFAGDANFKPAAKASRLLHVIPTAPPHVTLNPKSVVVTAGDGVTLTAAATGSPVPDVQWQVSTDGGKTFANVTANTSATTATFVFISNAGENGYRYRAVFTNRVGQAVSKVVTLTVQTDTGGGDA